MTPEEIFAHVAEGDGAAELRRYIFERHGYLAAEMVDRIAEPGTVNRALVDIVAFMLSRAAREQERQRRVLAGEVWE